MAASEEPAELESNQQLVDATAAEWRQGDTFSCPGLSAFVAADRHRPITTESVAAAAEDPDGDGLLLLWYDEEEFVIVSQDCDVVDSAHGSPYLTVSPMVTIENDSAAGEARRGYMPNYAPVPASGDNRFADLSRVATVEKALLLSATRIGRLADAEQARLFRGVVHRHFSRIGFPDELARVLKPFRDNMRDKKDRDSPEGRAFEAIEEIRVKAFPDWEGDAIAVTLHLLLYRKNFEGIVTEAERSRSKNPLNAPDEWVRLREKWNRQCAGALVAGGQIKEIEVSVDFFEEFSSGEYVDTSLLDLGGMSPQPD